MLKVDTELLENRQAKLTVSVESERLEKELKAAARRISARVNIPGFRKGKAPYQIIARYVGDEYIYEEALEPLSQAVYREALENTGIEPYAPGILDDVTREPLVLTFTVPLQPEVDLGGYREVRVKYEAKKITDHDVEHAIEHMLDDQATLEHVDRAIEWEDVAAMDIKGEFVDAPKKGKKAKEEAEAESEGAADDKQFIDRAGVRILIGKKATYPVPGFPKEVVGMAAGDEKSFDIKLPTKSEDIAEELLGRTIHFDVKCNEVFKRDVPELDDDFAQSVGDYADVADLKAKVHEQMERESEISLRNDYVNQVFDELLNKNIVKVDYPPIVIEQQIDDMVQDFERQIKRQGMNLDDYLNLNNYTPDKMRDDFRESAEEQVKRGLILGKIVEAEKLKVTDEDIEDEIANQLLSFGSQAALARQLYSSPEIRRSLASRRLTDKGLDRIRDIARGQAPAIEEGDGEEEPEEKPKAKKASTRKKKDAPAEAAEPAAESTAESQEATGESADSES